MIMDKLNNYRKYIGIHSGFKKAFDYLTTTDFSTVEVGKYNIEKENIFALVQEFSPKAEEECNLESTPITFTLVRNGRVCSDNILVPEKPSLFPPRDSNLPAATELS